MMNISCPLAFILAAACVASAQSNIDPTNKFGWTENCGWTNWRDANAGAQGVVVGPTFLRGFIWGENVGWINTGNGAGPYLNSNNTNFGVNILGSGFLSGFAWGENIGWINFGTQPSIGAQGARYDSVARRFRGYAWGENIGWVNLDDATRYVALAPACCPGDADSSGVVNFTDITFVLANLGASYGGGNTGPGDADCSGTVNFTDITIVLANLGAACS